jgi:pimeloyl-ACP methyl ester carboxylesterase
MPSTEECSSPAAAPPRPPRWQEAAGEFMLRAFGPKLRREELPEIPADLEPWEAVAIPRRQGAGSLSGLWFPAAGEARGAVLLVHPWLPWGKAYFYRRHRIEELRKAGYHTLIFDLPGFGDSGPPQGFYDRDVSAALAFLRGRAPGLPLHIWGVSSGGYWAHAVIATEGGVTGAFFEDVAPHLLEWSWRAIPKGRPFYLIFRTFLPTAYRYIDIRRHARARRAAAVAYVSGDRDPGVRPEDTLSLSEAAGGEAIVIPGAEHLGSIKRANRKVLAAAIALFARAEAAASTPPG